MRRFLSFSTIATLVLFGLLAHAEPLPLNKKVSLELDGIPLVQVINTLAQQNHFNVVYAGKIEGTVTMRLDSVDLASALNAVLMANGYTYVATDDIVIVKSIESVTPGDLSSRKFTLAYADAEATLRAISAQLSPRGKAVILAPDKAADKAVSTYRANALVVTDYPSILAQITGLISKIDIPERTVLIEAKIIETTVEAERKLGILWPSALDSRATGITDVTTDQNAAGVNLNGGKWTWGTLSVSELDATLDMLQSNGNSKLLSDPRIMATENHEAEIKIATVIPVQTLNRFTEGAALQDIVSFEDEEVGISLRVTARINNEGTITLDVNPQVDDIIGYTGPANNQRPIKTTRTITTRITVHDGESVALGGLLKDDTHKQKHSLPFFGSIPLLGKVLFTNTSDQQSTSDLMIFITPKIVASQDLASSQR